MESTGLKQSRWAPSSSRLSNNENRLHNGSVPMINSITGLPIQRTLEQKCRIAQLQDFQRFLRLLRRLKWKSSTLLFCHEKAISQQTDNMIFGLNFPIRLDSDSANAAEIMFKVDFFEYYALLEKALVHLLGCFGMVINADHTNSSVPLPLSEIDENARAAENSLIGDSVAFHGTRHRFHQNVLAALDRPSNPLHTILGTSRIRQYLGISKEFRNRWKEVELENTGNENQFADLHKSYHQLLVDLKLDEMLAALLTALEQCKVLAAAHVQVSSSVEIDMVNGHEEQSLGEMMIGDAMEWD